MGEAAKLYHRLVKEFGMPECRTLMVLGNQWYEAPEGVNDDPNEAISTAVFRLLPEHESDALMARYASQWCATFIAPSKENPAPSSEPITRLRQVIAQAGKRKKK
jgi:hypothetical protein